MSKLQSDLSSTRERPLDRTDINVSSVRLDPIARVAERHTDHVTYPRAHLVASLGIWKRRITSPAAAHATCLGAKRFDRVPSRGVRDVRAGAEQILRELRKWRVSQLWRAR